MDTVSEAVLHHLSEPEVGDGILAALADSPVHIAALVPQELVVDSKVSGADNKVAADFVG